MKIIISLCSILIPLSSVCLHPADIFISSLCTEPSVNEALLSNSSDLFWCWVHPASLQLPGSFDNEVIRITCIFTSLFYNRLTERSHATFLLNFMLFSHMHPVVIFPTRKQKQHTYCRKPHELSLYCSLFNITMFFVGGYGWRSVFKRKLRGKSGGGDKELQNSAILPLNNSLTIWCEERSSSSFILEMKYKTNWSERRNEGPQMGLDFKFLPQVSDNLKQSSQATVSTLSERADTL